MDTEGEYLNIPSQLCSPVVQPVRRSAPRGEFMDTRGELLDIPGQWWARKSAPGGGRWLISPIRCSPPAQPLLPAGPVFVSQARPSSSHRLEARKHHSQV
jgi:hypothetical protein